MADIEVPQTDTTRTTILGYAKYALTALMWLAGILGIDVTASGLPILPDAGSQWYVYVIVIVLGVARMIVGMLQSKAMADAKPA